MALCKFRMSLKMLKIRLKNPVSTCFIKTYGDGQVCSGGPWRDRRCLNPIQRASGLQQICFHHEAERKRKVRERERETGRERRLDSQVFCCY